MHAADPRTALRNAIRSRHERLDSGLRIAAADATYADYIGHLAALHGWLQPVEQHFWRQRAWPARLQPAQRSRKAEWIHADLRAAAAAGVQVPALQACPELPDTAAPQAYALGVLYVVEGSQLGGRMLYKRYSQAHPCGSFRYLDGYGEALGGLWIDYLAFLEQTLDTPDAMAQACRGACDAFDTLNRWLAARGQMA